MTAGPAANHAFSITIERAAGGTVQVDVEGDVDLATAPQLQVALLAEVAEAARPGEISVNLTRVRFLDAVGIGALIDARNAAQRAGLGFSVHNPRPIVRRVVDALGLAEVLRVSPAAAGPARAPEPGTAERPDQG